MNIHEKRSKFRNVETVIFDMDGVITGEREYWNSADLTVLELHYSRQFLGLKDSAMCTVLHKPGVSVELKNFVSEPFAAFLKNNGINTNWDLAYFSAVLYLIDYIAMIRDSAGVERIFKAPITDETFSSLGELLPTRNLSAEHIDNVSAFFMNFREKRIAARGELSPDEAPERRAEMFEADINAWRYERTGLDAPVFKRGDDLWQLCTTLFQEWYLGDSMFSMSGTEKLSNMPKDGMIWFEKPIIPVNRIISTLAMLKEAGLTFGVATGRPYDEIMIPLHKWGLLNFFDSRRMGTHREIAEAEAHIAESGGTARLAKPHPYIYLRAIFPGRSIDELLAMPLPIDRDLGEKTVIVGDSLSDLMAARVIGCRSAVVMTGVIDLETVRLMKTYEPDFVLEDITNFEDLL